MESIDKANDCDLKYRASKNQRLLVELTLMQIASITFDGEKKKPANYIIPATFFTSLSPVAKEIQKPTAKIEVEKPKVETPKKRIPKPILKNVESRSSSLSLKSIHQKKEVKKSSKEENYDHHSKTVFSEKDLQKLWKEYATDLHKKGQKSIASILATDTPKLLENFVIEFTLPNSLMQHQLQKEKPKLLQFLRKKLNNYGIAIDVKVNEIVEKKFAYTPQEKFNKLKEKNPLIEKLRQTFELDL